MDLLNQIKDIVTHTDPASLLLIVGILTSAAHGLLKKYKTLSKITNVAVSFVLPLVGAVLACLVANGSVLTRYAEVYAVAQAAYQVVKAIQRSAITKQLQTETQNF